MKLRFFLLPLAGFAATAVATQAQTFQRTATMRGGGNGSEGKCTIEVVVDGAAQVEVRGTSATLITLKGQPAQWRRFECNAPLPANPDRFRFAGVDGRGRQTLIREPRGGSPAVVEINDPDNGSEGYTFDLIWGDRNNFSQDRGQPGGYPVPPPPNVRPDYGRGGSFGIDQAVRICQDNIRQQVADRYRTNDVRFRDTRIDDNPGRRDWVIGTVEVRVPRRPDQIMSFSCSVDFSTGRVRSADMQAYSDGRGFPGPGGGRGNNALAIQNCERAAQQRLRDQGFGRITLGESRMDFDRGPRVNGDLRAYGRDGARSFRFSCAVEPRDGDVKSVDVFPLRN
ncbi:MAG: hypothetical protein ABUS51_08820 [Acidobacteriota bacterium]